MKDLITFSKLDWIVIIAFVFAISLPISLPYILYRLCMRYIAGKPLYDDPNKLLEGNVEHPNLVSFIKSRR